MSLQQMGHNVWRHLSAEHKPDDVVHPLDSELELIETIQNNDNLNVNNRQQKQ